MLNHISEIGSTIVMGKNEKLHTSGHRVELVGDRFYIYLEYVHPSSIVNYIRDHCGAITESVVRNFTRHILSGLAYLHSTRTIHRDIKGANLLVDVYGVVKLADFGISKHSQALQSRDYFTYDHSSDKLK